MATIRLMRAEGEFADVPEGTADEAYLRKIGFKDLVEPEEPGEGDDLSDLSLDDLKARAAALGLEVEGSGAGGRVLKADLAAAIEAAEATE